MPLTSPHQETDLASYSTAPTAQMLPNNVQHLTSLRQISHLLLHCVTKKVPNF